MKLKLNPVGGIAAVAAAASLVAGVGGSAALCHWRAARVRAPDLDAEQVHRSFLEGGVLAMTLGDLAP